MTEMTEKTETATVQGRIIRALGGFYYIDTPEGLVECRARGVFRKEGVTPYVGDLARAELTGEGKGYLIELLPRKNFLIRPPVANIDLLVLVVSTVSPAPNRFVLDKMLAVAEHKGIEPMLAVTKSDLRRDPELLADYRKAGYRCLELSSATGEGVAELREQLTGGRLVVFSGNTGAGKSSLLNALEPGLSLATGEVSEKLGRGRHTTRHVELYPVGGGFLADTPGFSSVELEKFAVIRKEELAGCFREFQPYVGTVPIPGRRAVPWWKRCSGARLPAAGLKATAPSMRTQKNSTTGNCPVIVRKGEEDAALCDFYRRGSAWNRKT